MIEIEKKYKLTKEQFEKIGYAMSTPFRTHREENTLFTGNNLKASEVLRIRKVSDAYGFRDYVLTYKGKATKTDGVKSRVETEFNSRQHTVKDFILALGYKPTVVYEKNRNDWFFLKNTLSLDELPFGYYMEIEGTEESIKAAELAIKEQFGITLDTEHLSYPDLTHLYGKAVDGVMEARF